MRALPDALPKAPEALPKMEAVTEKAPDMGDPMQPGLVSSLLEREETSAPPPAAAAARTRPKPLVDYASIYNFLGVLRPCPELSKLDRLHAASVALDVACLC